MKVIITGCTGFIGSEVLNQCLQNPSVTSIIALSRRELPASITSNSKLKVVIIKDFLHYSEELQQDAKDAEACIWALGKARMPDNETARKVSIDYTLAAAKAFREASEVAGDGKKLRFVYLSGAAAERDQERSLWFIQEYRKIRGQVENDLISYAVEHQDSFETYIMRPGFVLAKQASFVSVIKSLATSVSVDALAAKMVDVALRGNKEQILENSMIKQAKD